MAERIYIIDTELERLRALVEQHSEGRDGAAAERLDAELDRAIVLNRAALPPDVVTIESRVAFEDARSGIRREVVIVYPTAADVSTGHISVLAPIGAALIGQRQGDELDWPLPDGRVARIRILAVSQPAVAPVIEERAVASGRELHRAGSPGAAVDHEPPHDQRTLEVT